MSSDFSGAPTVGATKEWVVPMSSYWVLSQSLFLMNLESCRSLNLWCPVFRFCSKNQTLRQNLLKCIGRSTAPQTRISLTCRRSRIAPPFAGAALVRGLPISVFVDQRHATVPSLGDAADQIDEGACTRIERDLAANRGHRIEHWASAAGQACIGVQRLRVRRAVAAADETHSIRFKRQFAAERLVHGQQVKHPRRRIVGSARPVRAEDRPVLGQDLGLDEELVERRVGGIGGSRCEHDFGVAGDIEHPACIATVADAYAPQLDVVVG